EFGKSGGHALTAENQDYRGDSSSRPRSQTAPAVAAETLRSAAASADAPAPAKSEERLSIFWRVFGGTILSITALVCVTLYNQLSNGLNDLRGEVARLTEAKGDLLRKDEFAGRLQQVWTT